MSQRSIITGGPIIDGTGGNPLPRHCVVIDGETIEAVVPAAHLQPRTDDLVYDLGGRTLLPGLIDAHVHLLSSAGPKRSDVHLWNVLTAVEEQTLHAAANARSALHAGVTTVRDAAGGRAEVAVKRAVDDGVVEGARVLVAGFVGMTAGHGDLMTPAVLPDRLFPVADGVDECRKLVREYARLGVDWIKICTSGGVLSLGDEGEWRNYTRAEIDVIVDEAHALGKRVAAHAHTASGARVAVEAGVDTLEHGSGLDEELAELMLEHGTALCPTLTVAEYVRLHGARRGLPEESLRKSRELYERRLAAVRTAYRAGVPLIMGTDANNTVPFGLHGWELQLLHELIGVPAGEAIVAATSRAAQVLGIGARTGSIEPGKWADLLVVDGDPLADIGVLADRRRLVTVFQAGRRIDLGPTAEREGQARQLAEVTG
jgi:imidazolonepropionase-like amidohydrolase